MFDLSAEFMTDNLYQLLLLTQRQLDSDVSVSDTLSQVGLLVDEAPSTRCSSSGSAGSQVARC